MRIHGIDFSVDPKKCGIAFGEIQADKCILSDAFCLHDKDSGIEKIKEFIKSEHSLIAIDAPLGWPASMGKVLSDHNAGCPMPPIANRIFRRFTDRYVKKVTGKQSLDVGADKIARTALGALNFIHEICPGIKLAENPGSFNGTYAIEVYPALSLIQHKILKKGYKGKEETHKNARKEIIDMLIEAYPDNVEFDCWNEGHEISNDHILDAVICVLAGIDFLTGDVYLIRNKTEKNIGIIRKEGWIWFKKEKFRL